MRLLNSILIFFVSIVVLVSCKENTDKDITDAELQTDMEEVVTEPVEDKPSPEEAQRQSNSVMARVMSSGDCNTFASYLVSAELSEVLLSSEGPITVFAPSDTAMSELDEETVKDLLNMESKAALIAAVRVHVVEGNYDSVAITQALKQGKVTLTSMNGETLLVSKTGNDIYIEDARGNKAKVGKSDIIGSNGVVHIVDTFLGLD